MRLGRSVLLLAPLLVAVLALAQLWLAGRHHETVIASNLESPRLSSGRRLIDLLTVPEQQARVFNVTLSSADGAPELRTDARVRIQLAGAGESRLLLVRDGHPEGSRWQALREWLAGDAHAALVADGGWLDLGPVPARGAARHVQIVGLLSGAYAFPRVVPPPPEVTALTIALAGWSAQGLQPVPAGVRFTVVAPDPLELREVLARVLFFVAGSRVLTATALLAALAFAIGWCTLDRARHAAAAFLLLAAAVLAHAILLPPLQGADETSHVATAEGLAAKGVKYRSWWYPESIAVVAGALDQDRVQHQPQEALPLRGERERARLAAVLESPLERELQRPGDAPTGAYGLVAESRAPAFYQVFRALGPLAPQLAVTDRLALYRLGAVAMALALLGAGLGVLVACRLGGALATAYCALFTFPYAVIAMASCSNYAPAIGCGALVGAAAVAAVRAREPGARRASRVVLVASAWLGVAFWRDFGAGAIVLTVLVLLGLPPFADAAEDSDAGAGTTPRPRRRVLVGLLAAAAALLGGVLLWSGAGALGPELIARVTVVAERGDAALYLLVLAPLVSAIALVAIDRRHRDRPPAQRRRDAITASLALGAATIVLWLVTPATRVPYETTFLRGWSFLSTVTRTVLSTNLSWDQDRLTWKFVLGAGGWHDVFLPDVLYAVARWLAVAVVVALPVLSLRCRVRRPRVAAALLLLAGIGGTLMATSLAIRHAASLHPYGRFALPWLGLALLPVIARVRVGRDEVARLVLRVAVLLHLWVSFVVVGLRYGLGG
jgi:hypothetical protein